MSKALRKQGAEVLSEKKCPLPVNGLHSGLKTGHGGASLWKQGAGACWKRDLPCDRFPVDHGRVHKNIYVRVSGGASNPIPLHCKPLPFLPVRVIQ